MKYFKTYLFILVSSCFFSCEGDMDMRYKWIALNAVNADHSGREPAATTQTILPAINYVLRLELVPMETDRRKGRYVDSEMEPKNVNPVDSILITSTTNFSTAYPAGAALNDLFLIYNGNLMQTSPVDAFYITNVYRDNYTDKPIPDHADLLLMQKPDSVRSFRFAVYLHFKDRTVFTDTTSAIVLTP